MDCLRSKVSACVLMLLVCLSTMLSLSAAVSATPTETSVSMSPIGTATAWAAVATVGDNVYIIGGCLSVLTDITTCIDTVQIYNVKTMETTYGTPMPKAVAAAAYGLGPDGKIYVAGGWNDVDGSYYGHVQRYDPADDSWNTSVSTTPSAVGRSASAMGPNGNLYVFGSGWASGQTLIYNIMNDTWWSGQAMPYGTYDSAALYYNSTSVFVFGGLGPTNLVQVYNPTNNTWRSATPYPGSTAFQRVVLARNGYIYSIGGSGTGDMADTSPYSTIARYSASDDEWTPADTSLYTGAMHMGVTADVYGRLLVIGGWDGSSIVNSVQGIIVGELPVSDLEIISPGQGEVVSGLALVQVDFSNFMISAIDFFVDTQLMETRTTFFLPPITFQWNTTGLADGSQHRLMVRAFHPDGTVSEDSVTVTVSALSIDDKIASLQADLNALQAQLGTSNSNLTTQVAILQAQLNGLLVGVGNMSADQAAALGALQQQLNDFKTQIDRVESKADNSGIMGLATIGLVVVGLVLLGMMFMSNRRKGPGPPVS